jgi:hypothetical protein
MADAATTTTTTADTTTTTPTTTTTANWYDGKATPEQIGLWQNKQWSHTDPMQLALQVTQAYEQAEKFIGVPHDELVRLPKNPVAPEWQGVWDRLGVPKEPAGYDLSGVKFKDGRGLDPAAELALRNAAHKAHVPASAMPDFTGEFVNYLESQEASEAAETTAKLQVERTALAQNWGSNMEVNKFIAAQGAKALGLDESVMKALESTAGYAKTMEALLRVGQLNKEDRYVTPGGQTGIMSKEQATQRLSELKRDPVWSSKLLAGDQNAGREFSNLTLLMNGGPI